MTPTIPLGRCHEPGCRRATRSPEVAHCDAHRVRWEPEWRRRLRAKDLTGALFPERGGVA